MHAHAAHDTMTLYILTETSAGYALLKARDKKLLKNGNVAEQMSTVEDVCGALKLKKFEKFDSAATALEEVAALVDGKVTPMLARLLDSIKDEKKASLAVADPKLGRDLKTKRQRTQADFVGIAINKLPELQITPISDSTTVDLYRAIRSNLSSLIPGLLPDDISTMSLGLSHSLSRHKLKFSPEKVDTMIIQAIALLDDLDKELNTYAMRVKEWYGWHFPEMAKIINDNLAYARVIMKMGIRTNAGNADLAEILPEEIEVAVKAAAEISMGTEISSEDLDNIRALAEQVIDFTEYRQQLSSYLTTRMQAIAPNLTTLVGDLVGARLIAHAGSLMNLAKSPASTIQILGAEKALFRALKTKHDTPKYGLIYHASLVGQATGKNKGKIARMLATKTALGLRVDSLADWGVEGEGKKREPTEEVKAEFGVLNRTKIERRLRALEGKPLKAMGVAIGPSGQAQPAKFELKEARKYNPDADGLAGESPAVLPDANGVNGLAVVERTKKLIEDLAEDKDEDDDEDEEMHDAKELQSPTDVNGHDGKEERRAKEARRAEKEAHRAEKAAKREAKAAKKAEKEAKKQAKAGIVEADAKKRKRDDEDGKVEKKKKKHKLVEEF